jgi:hypothetical protein
VMCGNGVMINDYGATTKPRASCGRPTKGCDARHALVSRSLVMIHYDISLMRYFPFISFESISVFCLHIL